MSSACNFSHCQLPSPNVGLLCRDLCVEVRRLICPCGSGLQIGVAHPRRRSGPIIFSFRSFPFRSTIWTLNLQTSFSLQIAAYYRGENADLSCGSGLKIGVATSVCFQVNSLDFELTIFFFFAGCSPVHSPQYCISP